MRLGRAVDPVVVPLLDRAGARLRGAPPPRDASQLYAGWLHARAGLEGYPARLALRGPDGAVTARLNLDSLELPEATVSTPGRQSRTDGLRARSLRCRASPASTRSCCSGSCQATCSRWRSDRRARLLAADQLGALLDPTALGEPPYRIALSPPTPGLTPDTRRLRWKREGWVVHGERAVQVADGVRVTHAEVDLRGPFPLLVRGALVVVLDAAVLALIWLLAEAIAGIPPAVPSWRRLRRSFRVRVAVALAGVLPHPRHRLRGLGGVAAQRRGRSPAGRGDHGGAARRARRHQRPVGRRLVRGGDAGSARRRDSARSWPSIEAVALWRRRIRSWPPSRSWHPCRTRAPFRPRRSGARSKPPPTSRCSAGEVGSGTGSSGRVRPISSSC